jgi:hypothetical protein
MCVTNLFVLTTREFWVEGHYIINLLESPEGGWSSGTQQALGLAKERIQGWYTKEFHTAMFIKTKSEAGHQWFMPVILVT